MARATTGGGSARSATNAGVMSNNVYILCSNLTVDASALGSALTLTTSNVRSMTLDGDALTAAGITSVTVDGDPHAVTTGPLEIGPQTGKRAGLHGPLNQVYQRPFCFVYDEAGPAARRSRSA